MPAMESVTPITAATIEMMSAAMSSNAIGALRSIKAGPRQVRKNAASAEGSLAESREGNYLRERNTSPVTRHGSAHLSSRRSLPPRAVNALRPTVPGDIRCLRRIQPC